MTRGEVWWADFGIPFGSEPGSKRPVLVIQDDEFNASDINTVVTVPFSTNLVLADAPGNVYFQADASGLPKDSVLVCSQINAIDRRRLVEKISKVEKRYFSEIEDGVRMSWG